MNLGVTIARGQELTSGNVLDYKEWTGANIGKCVRWAADREYWREMTANLPAVVTTPR